MLQPAEVLKVYINRLSEFTFIGNKPVPFRKNRAARASEVTSVEDVPDLQGYSVFIRHPVTGIHVNREHMAYVIVTGISPVGKHIDNVCVHTVRRTATTNPKRPQID